MNVLREKCPKRSFFWSVFPRIRTEKGEILRISPYSVSLRIQSERWKIRTRKNSVFGHFSRSDAYFISSLLVGKNKILKVIGL